MITPYYREGMERLIDREPDMEVCGQSDGESISGVFETEPDVVILDLSLKSSNGLDLIHTIKAQLPKTAVFVLIHA